MWFSFCETLDARKPNSWYMVKENNRGVNLFSSRGTQCSRPFFLAASVPGQASPVVVYVTHVHCTGKGVWSQLTASLLLSSFPLWQRFGVLCQPGLEEQPAPDCTESGHGERLKKQREVTTTGEQNLAWVNPFSFWIALQFSEVSLGCAFRVPPQSVLAWTCGYNAKLNRCIGEWCCKISPSVTALLWHPRQQHCPHFSKTTFAICRLCTEVPITVNTQKNHIPLAGFRDTGCFLVLWFTLHCKINTS